ncbi:MAG: hypothetical protein HY906_15315 [Deltaproteobacteria bacterium]|nr:hypothetical protein [Deltaproteobacteria bacterium]
MSVPERKVVVVPCSGIGKAQGSVSREAAFELALELRPQATEIVALSMLVLGDEGARRTVAHAPAITIDGCKLMCAAKMVRLSGGTVAEEATVMDAYRRHRHLKPHGIAQLNEAGLKLARVLAEELAAKVDVLKHATPAASPPGAVPHA